MDAKQRLNSSNPAHCPITGYSIYTYSSFPETFITLFRASMGGYDVSPQGESLAALFLIPVITIY